MRERERQLANVPRDTLLRQTVSKEYELREAKHLLTTALIQLEAIREKFIHEREFRLSLEVEKKEQAVKTTKALIDTQQDVMDAKEEIRRFQLQLENSQTELQKAREVVHQLESDKTGLERELVRARDTARTFKERNAVLHAREEGRREGFDEGLRQGRVLHGIVDLSQVPHLPSPVESNAKESNKSSQEKPSRHKSSVNERHVHSDDTEVELRKIAEKDNYRLNLQLTQLSRELDQQRQKTKEVEADRKHLADEAGRLKRELRAKDEEIARLVERGATLTKELQTLERRGKESVARRESQVEDLKTQVQNLLIDNGNLQKQKEDVEKKMKEEKEKERERREKERAEIGASSSSTEPRISYIPMPPPPIPPNIPTSGPVPRAPSSGSGSVRLPGRRRFSVESQSSTGSALLERQSPPGSANNNYRLSVIPETDDVGSNASSHPAWNPTFPQPMIHQIQIIPPQSQSPRVMMPTASAPNPHLLQPTGNYLYGIPNGRSANANGSQSTIQIDIEPPSRPASSVDNQDIEPLGAFLSPNHRPAPLPSQDAPLPVLPRIGRNHNSNPAYDYDASTQSNTPVIPGVTVPMPQMPRVGNSSTPVIDGPLPPGFIPQTITDSKGISTPIWQNGTLPSGGPPQLPHSSSSSQRAAPIYGNPLNHDQEDEDEPYVPFSPYGPGVRPGGPTTRPNGTGPGVTPTISSQNLPGSGGANMGPRSGVSIYGPGPAQPVVPPPLGNSWGYSPGPVIPGPLPHSAPSPEEDEHDDIDPQTALNTRINAAIGKRTIPPGQDFGRGGNSSGYSNNWRR